MNGKTKDEGEPQFPNVACDIHPTEPGYAVCVHVLDLGAPVFNFEPATRRNLGTVCCASCFPLLDRHDKTPTLNEGELETILASFIICCAGHVRDKGWKATIQ